MKKGIFGFMAILAIFAMTMTMACSSGGGGGSTPPPPGPPGPGPNVTPITVTFDYNYGEEDPDYADMSDPFDVPGIAGEALGEFFPEDPETREISETQAFKFIEWNTSALGNGDAVEPTTVFDDDETVYAIWQEYDPSTTAWVTFWMNDGTEDKFCDPISVTIGDALGEDFPAEEPTRDGYTFLGWSIDPAATEADFDEGTFVEENTDVYAVWEEGEEATVEVSFKWNYNGAPSDGIYAKKIVNVGEAISDFPASPTALGYTFGGWYFTAAGVGDTFTGSTIVNQTEDFSVYAKWTAQDPGFTVPNDWPTLAADDIVEEITLANGWAVIYQFVLPADKVWEDYEPTVTVEHKIADVNTGVRARVWGNYTPAEVKAATFGAYNGKNIAVVGSWPGGSSGRWIWNNTYGNVTPANTLFNPAPTNDTWFTVSYKVDGTAAHSAWNAGETAIPGRNPAATDKGPFFIGVGLSTTGDPVTSQIKNVTLKGLAEAGTDDLIGMPLYYKSTNGTLFRAYVGQLDGNIDSDGFSPNFNDGKPSWSIISGNTNIVPISGITPPNPAPKVTITFKANYGATDSDFASQPADTTKIIAQGGKLGAADLAKLVRTGYAFLGWYDAATGGTKATVNDTYDVNTSLFAHWKVFETPSVNAVYEDDGLDGLITADGGAYLDEEGDVVMAIKGWNATHGEGEIDSLMNIAWPADLAPEYNKVTITYTLKIIQAVTPDEGWTAGYGATAKLYGTWSTISGTSGNRWPSFATSGGTLEYTNLDDGISFQFNTDDTNANVQRRDGVYAVVVSKLEFSYVAPAP